MPTSPASPAVPPAIVLMGVSGSGKSSVGGQLSARLGLPFHDADKFHPRANVDKMAAGIPLTDDDRWPWLDAIGRALRTADRGTIVACSALRRAYRDRLRTAAGRAVMFVHLSGSRQTIAPRIGARTDHFMPASLLDSQFATLEPPGPDEYALTVSVEPGLDAVVAAIVAALPQAIDRAPVAPRHEPDRHAR